MDTQLISIDDVQKALAQNDEEQLKVLVEKTTENIFSNIVRITEKIEKSKQLVKDAENAKGNFLGFGKTAKRTELNTKAISQQNEALVEINVLIKESVTLTCCSIFFAKSMIETMSVMMVGGFKDVDGNTTILSDEQQKHAQVILQQAKNFVEHQTEYEARQEKQEIDIKTLQGDMREKDSLDEQQSQDISQNRENILKNQQVINQNRELIAQNKEALEALKAKNNSLATIVSIVALIISGASIALHFI
ncbi:hypothetical protein [Helicobacter typhlonius]|uniref:Uncharacterized protein n=3 Tax=Helicobacter typhlonius TaxID=76936 RepID=A0A099UCJ4_9HELI|nr:hypothetical protein [Helicobacter typhlonius]TLD78376.1 hypothetical protein LS75_006290 [Helicobacter typhlonius]CUU39141.1 Hypothetical protein BN2458_PEG0254 [Helicobacter typhlonius]HCD73240.1 hypothetical protein [Helicobacter sp.]